MATTAKKKARPGRAPGPKKQPTRDEHPQLKICMHLASKPEQLLDRAELFGLLEADGLRRQQCYGALNTAKKAKRVRREGGAYRLTPGGLKWLQEQQQELGLEVTPATGKPPRAKPGRRVATPAAATAEFASKTTALAQRPFEPVVERSFRWGVFNDGALHLVKDGSSIELTEAEAGELLRGYGRMAQAAA